MTPSYADNKRVTWQSSDEKVATVDENGKIDAGKLGAFTFDQMRSGYYAVGEKVGQAWHSGAGLMKK